MNTAHRSRLTATGSLLLLLLALGLLITSTPALAEAPANDSFAGAIDINSLPYADWLNTSEATADPTDPTCGGPDATVWYRYTSDRDKTISITTWGGYEASDYETSLSVYSYDGASLSPVACVASSWDQPLVFDAPIWVTYYIMVSTWGSGGNLYLNVQEVLPPPPPPTNDDFDTPVWIGELPYTDWLDTRYATSDDDDPYCSASGATVWYALTAPATMQLEADTFGSMYDTTLSVYTYEMGDLVQLACNDDWSGMQSYVSVAANEDQEYYFMVGSFGGGMGGDLVFSVREFTPPLPPPNDDIGNAAIVYDLPYWDGLEMGGATSIGDPPACFTPYGTVWYVFTPSSATDLRAYASGHYFDPAIAVFSGTPDALDEVACGYWSVSFAAQANETYYFMVGDPGWYGPPSGYLYFELYAVQPPLTLDLTIDPHGTFSSITGAATVSGTVTCSRPAYVNLSGKVRQFVGRLNTLRGYFSTSFECDGATTWSAAATPENGRFAGGHAQVSASAHGYDWQSGDYAYVETSGTLNLSRAPR
jgi:hypothetical protein